MGHYYVMLGLDTVAVLAAAVSTSFTSPPALSPPRLLPLPSGQRPSATSHCRCAEDSLMPTAAAAARRWLHIDRYRTDQRGPRHSPLQTRTRPQREGVTVVPSSPLCGLATTTTKMTTTKRVRRCGSRERLWPSLRSQQRNRRCCPPQLRVAPAWWDCHAVDLCAVGVWTHPRKRRRSRFRGLAAASPSRAVPGEEGG